MNRNQISSTFSEEHSTQMIGSLHRPLMHICSHGTLGLGNTGTRNLIIIASLHPPLMHICSHGTLGLGNTGTNDLIMI